MGAALPRSGAIFVSALGRRAVEVTEAVVRRLPAVRALLEGNVRAAFDGDPAARFPDETLLCYPGVTAITQYRIAHELYADGHPIKGQPAIRSSRTTSSSSRAPPSSVVSPPR